MATKFKIETALPGGKWASDVAVRYDKKEDAIPVAEYISSTRRVQTRVVKVQTKTIWQSKKPEIVPHK